MEKMAKKNITICLDAGLIDQLKAQKINVSGLVNTYFSAFLYKEGGQKRGVSMQKLRKKAQILTKKSQKIHTSIQKINNKIAFYEDQRDKEELKMLEKAEKDAEKKKKCKNCGIYVTPKERENYTFPKGVLCRACYMAGDFKVKTLI